MDTSGHWHGKDGVYVQSSPKYFFAVKPNGHHTVIFEVPSRVTGSITLTPLLTRPWRALSGLLICNTFVHLAAPGQPTKVNVAGSITENGSRYNHVLNSVLDPADVRVGTSSTLRARRRIRPVTETF